MVKQHIDLRAIQSRLDRGLYSNCYQKFYRDLLVLFNNFIIFFKKTSQENAAARELRALVVKEMAEKLRKPKPESELELPRVISLSKASRGGSTTIVPCGKRSSVKALPENAASSRKEKVKPKVNEKKVSLVEAEEKGVKKKRSNERSVSGQKNSKSGSNSNLNSKNNKKGGGGEAKHQYGNNELSSHDALDTKIEKKEISMKKRGAASFLRRMKQNSPKKAAEESDEEEEEDNEEDEEEEKDSDEESEESRLEEEEMKKGRRRNNSNNNSSNSKKNINNKRDVRRERVTRSSSNTKGGGGEREESGKAGKKVTGRPPKRSAAVGAAGDKKRGRDNGESENAGVGSSGGKPSKKRTRR